MAFGRVLCRAAMGIALSILAATSVAATTWEVAVNNFNFSPPDLQIRLGDTVHWTNSTGTPHTVTSDGGAFDSGAASVNFSFTHTFTTSGSFDYHCEVHPSMVGTIEVVPAPDEVLETLTAWDFQSTPGSANVASGSSEFSRNLDSGGVAVLIAGLGIPSGSTVTRLEIEGCLPTPPTPSFAAQIHSCPANSQTCTEKASVTANGGLDACLTAIQTLTPGSLVIDNLQASYFVTVTLENLSDPGGGPGFRAVRIFYRRQVSPDPVLLQTFADVPASSDQHRYIEALAAAGITLGCGAGNFCPDNPVTRGQLAVLLARALGLWPN